jgi:hypothetical protein
VSASRHTFINQERWWRGGFRARTVGSVWFATWKQPVFVNYTVLLNEDATRDVLFAGSASLP